MRKLKQNILMLSKRKKKKKSCKDFDACKNVLKISTFP